MRVRRAPGYRDPAVRRSRYDLILSNILARPLALLARDLRRALAPGGRARGRLYCKGTRADARALPLGPGAELGRRPVGRQQDVFGHRNVRRREAPRAAPTVASLDDAAHLVRPAEQLAGEQDIAGDQRPPDGRRRDLLFVARRRAVRADEREAHDLEPQFAPHLFEQGDVAAPLMTEVEVGTDDDELGVEAADEDLAHEVFCGLVRTLFVEMHDQGIVDIGLLEQLELLIEIGEQPRRGLGAHDAGGMTIEGDDRGGEPAVARQSLHGRDDLTVPAVHTVVRADGDHRALRRTRALVEIAQRLHCRRG